MSASPFADFQATAGPANQNDDKMGQIRELVLGEYRRQCDARLALLEARLRETELSLQRRLDEMQLRIEQLSDASEANQRAAFEELARGIAELSDRVRPVR
jgi:DNA anti-recombination protein RmuC